MRLSFFLLLFSAHLSLLLNIIELDACSLVFKYLFCVSVRQQKHFSPRILESFFFVFWKVFVFGYSFVCFIFSSKCITKPTVRHCQLLLAHRQQLFEDSVHFYPLSLGCYHFQFGSSSIKSMLKLNLARAIQLYWVAASDRAK